MLRGNCRLIDHYVIQRSTANRDNIAAQLMDEKINTLAIDNQASHLAFNFLVFCSFTTDARDYCRSRLTPRKTQ